MTYPGGNTTTRACPLRQRVADGWRPSCREIPGSMSVHAAEEAALLKRRSKNSYWRNAVVTTARVHPEIHASGSNNDDANAFQSCPGGAPAWSVFWHQWCQAWQQ